MPRLDVGNNGAAPSQVDYAQTLARDGAGLSDPKSGFRTGRPVASADFDENDQPVNAQYPGAAPSLYTVRSGDTLQTIAQAACRLVRSSFHAFTARMSARLFSATSSGELPGR